MTARQLALSLTLVAGFVYAQGDNKPEIRGTVTDPSLNIGVAGAEITLFEFLLDAEKTVVRTQIATTSTDTRGEFRFPLQHFGEYFVEIKKEGYSVPVFGPGGNPLIGASRRADVDRAHPTQDLRFSLSPPGEITGRVVDEDGNPVAGVRVRIQNRDSPVPAEFEPGTVTGQDGSFTTRNLPGGQYLIRIAPKAGDFETATTQFSEDDLKVIDQDFDSTAAALVPVSPGASSGAGTIRVRKVPYYRAHVSVAAAECAPKENWMFSAIPKTPPFTVRYVGVPCGNEFLVRNLKPGAYWFALRYGKAGETGKWAVADVEINRENVDVSLAMSQAAEVNGRFIAAEGATLPKFERNPIMMRARMGALLGWAATGSADAEGKFTMKNLPWLPHDVSVLGLGGKYYIKEIRYNGVVMTDGLVRLTQGAPAQNLEIVLDDQPGTITGSVRDGDKPVSKPFVLVVKWPFSEGDVPISPEGLGADDQGRFRISGLAPGEYRVIGLARPVPFTQVSNQLLSRGETVTLERGGLQDLSLKLIDLSK